MSVSIEIYRESLNTTQTSGDAVNSLACVSVVETLHLLENSIKKMFLPLKLCFHLKFMTCLISIDLLRISEEEDCCGELTH